jgi:hypothetical protein
LERFRRPDLGGHSTAVVSTNQTDCTRGLMIAHRTSKTLKELERGRWQVGDGEGAGEGDGEGEGVPNDQGQRRSRARGCCYRVPCIARRSLTALLVPRHLATSVLVIPSAASHHQDDSITLAPDQTFSFSVPQVLRRIVNSTVVVHGCDHTSRKESPSSVTPVLQSRFR